jgi:hypothetical protein
MIFTGGAPMVRRITLAVVIGFAATFPAMAAETAPATTQAATKAAAALDLPGTLDAAIKLLEAGKHREVIELLLQPSEQEAMEKEGGIDKVVEQFKGEKADALLNMLKAAKEQKPTMNKDGTEAAFAGAAEGITFIKEDGKWHLKGH